MVQADDAQIGDSYENGQFIKPPAPPAPVPDSITMRQCRLQLLTIGMLDSVDAAINAIPVEGQRRAASIEWEYAHQVWRSSAWVTNLGAALGLTEAQLDDLFIQAATL
jgi:hypothetical protein